MVLGGRSYTVYETGAGAMNQGDAGTLYATYANRTCYLFETDVATISTGVVDDVSNLTSVQWRHIDAGLLEIMKSVRIDPKAAQ
jgi:hypothetical protein